MKKYTGSYQVYKSTGGAQISLIRPTRRTLKGKGVDKSIVDRNGAIFVQAAKGVAHHEYDWENKIVFALGLPDIAAILGNPKWEKKEGSKYGPSLFHPSKDDERKGKRLAFVPGSGKYAGTYMMQLSDSTGNKIMVPFSNGEYRVFMQLLQQSIPILLGFSD